MPTVSETLRSCITSCGKSRYQISQESGVDAAVLCRFVAGGELRSKNLDTLARYFNLVLRPGSKAGKKG